jgi:putative membrane protein
LTPIVRECSKELPRCYDAEVTTNDPRVYFAAERTLLAWVRTGIAIMALGFVVARFGLFLSLVPSAQSTGFSSHVSPLIGAALVLVGVGAIAAGALEYRRYCNSLRPEDLPSTHATRLPQVLAWSIVASGLALIVVLTA